MTFDSGHAADAFASATQAGDVLAPGLEKDFSAELVSSNCLLAVLSQALHGSTRQCVQERH